MFQGQRRSKSRRFCHLSLLLAGTLTFGVDRGLQAADAPDLESQPKGQVFAWGRGDYAETNVPASLTNAVYISASEDFINNFAIRSDGSAVSWGHQALNPSYLSNIVAIAPGVALRKDGAVVEWDSSGQISPVPGMTNISAITPRGPTIALQSNGTVVAWPGYWHLVAEDFTNITAIAAGYEHVTVLRNDGTVAQNPPALSVPPRRYSFPVPPGLTNVTAIAAGMYHNLALKSDGTVVAWGQNSASQCSVPLNLSNVVSIAASANHSLALRSDGTVVAWGDGSYGLNSPPASLTNVVRIACGYYHNVAIQAGPIFDSVPTNMTAQVGDTITFGATARATSPVLFQWFHEGLAIEGAQNPTLTLPNVQLSDVGTYTLWAASDGFTNIATARLGVGEVPTIITAKTNLWLFSGESDRFEVEVDGPPPIRYAWHFEGRPIPDATNRVLAFTSASPTNSGSYMLRITTGWGQQTEVSAYLHVISDRIGTITAWGWEDQIPPKVGPISALAVGQYHIVALRVDGTVTSWNLGMTNVPPGLREVTAVAAGGGHTLALLRNGTVIGWGRNILGQASPPTGLQQVVEIAAGDDFSVAVLKNGKVVTWGAGYPQPDEATNVVKIAAGSTHVVAVRNDGSIVAWGGFSEEDRLLLNSVTDAVSVGAGHYNTIVVKRDGSTVVVEHNAPPPFALTNVVQADIHYGHGLAALADGSIVSWGDNDRGQSSPPSGLSNVIAVAAGEWNSAALQETGTFIAPDIVSPQVYEGSNAVLSLTVKTTRPTWYQWQKEGHPIAGATNKTLQISAAQAGDAGSYSLVVSNVLGIVVSPPVVMRVRPIKPTVISQPVGGTVSDGGSFHFFITADGLGELDYQWLLNGWPILGATNSSMTISNIGLGQMGAYSVRISNAAGIAVSAHAILTVTGPGIIVDNPQAQFFGFWSFASGVNIDHYGADVRAKLAGDGSSYANFSTSIPRSGSYRVYDWRPGHSTQATNVLYRIISGTLTNTTQVNQRLTGSRWNLLGSLYLDMQSRPVVQITDKAVPPTSVVAADAVKFEYVPSPPSILSSPRDTIAAIGTKALFECAVDGQSLCRYQWQKDRVNISNATNLILEIPSVQLTDAGEYSLIVMSEDGVAISQPARLSVALAPSAVEWAGLFYQIRWAGAGVLQSATNVAGPYEDIPDAVSPHRLEIGGTQRFFRIRSAD